MALQLQTHLKVQSMTSPRCARTHPHQGQGCSCPLTGHGGAWLLGSGAVTLGGSALPLPSSEPAELSRKDLFLPPPRMAGLCEPSRGGPGGRTASCRSLPEINQALQKLWVPRVLDISENGPRASGEEAEVSGVPHALPGTSGLPCDQRGLRTVCL